ncbi:uncharacterized protein LOC130699167 [Daphnia carinata]|uniref:uncharacterized protein LOC130699167 n=1 Tax=Daphnia carinata TaxID=120202 RepID=UPI00257F20D7|nr:uncharacterized protein LOC130699167 [Daphnia carinata]
MLNSFQPTPSIVVEDVDHVHTPLGFQSPSSHRKIHDNNNVPSPLSLCTTFGIIKPDVDAYVTPLSLCQQPSTPKSSSSPVPLSSKDKVMVVSGGTMPPCLTTSGLESSFTSVDIGGPNHPAARSAVADNDSSWNSEFSQQTSSCFDFKSGLMCVTRAITSSADPLREKGDHHRIDISESPLELHDTKSGRAAGQPSTKRMSICSMIGIFFICLAVVGLIAIGISMYMEFVSKPLQIAESRKLILNETTICDYLLDSCDNGTLIIKNTAEPIHSNKTNTANESGRVEATFSSNFTSQLATKLPGTAA